jgi:hypothetical protein
MDGVRIVDVAERNDFPSRFAAAGANRCSLTDE